MSNSKQKPAIVFNYTDISTGAQKSQGFIMQMVNELPAFKEVFEKSNSEFVYDHDLSTNAMNAYFGIVRSRIQGKEPANYPDLTPQDWIYIFWLAYRLDDQKFFDENASCFPSIDKLINDVLKMPAPARLHYFGAYLGVCFTRECNCDHVRIAQLKEDAEEWLKSQPESDQVKYHKTQLLRSGNFKSKKGCLGYIYDRSGEMKHDWSVRIKTELQNGTIFNWYDLDLQTQIHLVHLQARIPECTCILEFTEVWHAFCTKSPAIAKFLWDNMKRNCLMKYAISSDTKADGVAARKGTFEELNRYIEFIRTNKTKK